MRLVRTTIAGAHVDDINLVLEGHVRDGYKVCITHNKQHLVFALKIECMSSTQTGSITSTYVFAVQFNAKPCLQKEDLGYNSSPTLNDRVHCLVSVLPGNKISLMEEAAHDVISRLWEIREKAISLSKLPPSMLCLIQLI